MKIIVFYIFICDICKKARLLKRCKYVERRKLLNELFFGKKDELYEIECNTLTTIFFLLYKHRLKIYCIF
jgi:hypothetical protein